MTNILVYHIPHDKAPFELHKKQHDTDTHTLQYYYSIYILQQCMIKIKQLNAVTVNNKFG